MTESVQKRVTDRLKLRLEGGDGLPIPDGLGYFVVDKDRRLLTAPAETPRVSVYSLKQQEPTAQGNSRRPLLLSRLQFVEARVLLIGDDDAMDGLQQWITTCFATVGTMDGLIVSLRESESNMDLLEDSTGKVLMWQSRWAIEYTTLPEDLTQTGRSAS